MSSGILNVEFCCSLLKNDVLDQTEPTDIIVFI